jgi:hypothetical protein
MASQRKPPVGLVCVGLFFVVVVILLVQPGAAHTSRLFLGWIAYDARLKLSLEQDAAGPAYYGATARGPVSLAGITREFRTAWPDQGVGVVNGAVCEVATALLHHGDVEVGDFDGNKFVAWPMAPWAAAEKINVELVAKKEFLEDERRYVFRRK